MTKEEKIENQRFSLSSLNQWLKKNKENFGTELIFIETSKIWGTQLL